MKKSTALLAVLGLLLFAGTASAKGNKFAECDKDGNGALSQQEYLQCFKRGTPEKFAALDANGDGQVTKEEIKAYRATVKAKKAAKKAKAAQ